MIIVFPLLYQPINIRPLGLVVKRITSTTNGSFESNWSANDKIASSILAEGIRLFPSLSSCYTINLSALWRSGYRARLEILFLRERRFESCQRRNFSSLFFSFKFPIFRRYADYVNIANLERPNRIDRNRSIVTRGVIGFQYSFELISVISSFQGLHL